MALATRTAVGGSPHLTTVCVWGGPHAAQGATHCSATGRVPRWLRAAHTVLPGGVPHGAAPGVAVLPGGAHPLVPAGGSDTSSSPPTPVCCRPP